MPDFDKQIADWRRQMLAAGIKTPAPLDELESHLRDDIEQQIRSGRGAQEAFEAATRRIGQAEALKLEFEKTGNGRGVVRKLMGLASVVLVGCILLLSGFTFFQMQMSLGEQIMAYAAVASTLAVACGWRYVMPFVPAIPNKRKRLTLGLLCILGGIGCSSFFCNVILPHFEHNHDGRLPAVGFWAVFPIAVFGCLGLGFILTAREREQRGMTKAATCS